MNYKEFVNRYFGIFSLRTVNVLYRYGNKTKHNDGTISKEFLMDFLADSNFYNGRIVRQEVEDYIRGI